MDLRIGKDRFRPMEEGEQAIGRSTQEMVAMQRAMRSHDDVERCLDAVENACADLRRALGREK